MTAKKRPSAAPPATKPPRQPKAKADPATPRAKAKPARPAAEIPKKRAPRDRERERAGARTSAGKQDSEPPRSAPPASAKAVDAGPMSRRSEVIAEAVREASELLAGARANADEAKKRAEPPKAAAPPLTLSSDEIEARIRELEGRLDTMMARASAGTLVDDEGTDDDDDEAAPTPRMAPTAPRSTGAPVSTPPPSRASVPAPPSSRALAPDVEPTAFDTARELLSTNYYLRKWGRLGLRNRSEEVDDFGYDPVYESKVKRFLDFLYDTYFRVEASGTERIPREGRCLLVANHSGTLPFDGLMIRAAVKRANGDGSGRDVRWLAEDFIFHFPFIGSFTTRIGAVRACQENAERLLRQESLVAVFPEGMKGTGKLFRDRYRLQRFGRGGFVKLALRTKTPIVPVAVLGGEETQPLLARLDALGKPFGFPYVPVTPTFPLLGPIGLAPAPTKWRIQFGEPIHLPEGPEAADDELLVGRVGEHIRGTIQEMVDELVRARRSVFFG